MLSLEVWCAAGRGRSVYIWTNDEVKACVPRGLRGRLVGRNA